MSGLNRGTPSPLAWPLLSAGVDLFLAIGDDDARAGMRDLADAGIAGGECAGAGLGALRAWQRDGGPTLPGVGPSARVLSFVTEGPTDPDGYRAAVGRSPGRGPRRRVTGSAVLGVGGSRSGSRRPTRSAGCRGRGCRRRP